MGIYYAYSFVNQNHESRNSSSANVCNRSSTALQSCSAVGLTTLGDITTPAAIYFSGISACTVFIEETA